MRERFSSPFCKEAFTDYRQNPLLMLHLDQAISITCVEALLLRVESEFSSEMRSMRRNWSKLRDELRRRRTVLCRKSRELVNLLDHDLCQYPACEIVVLELGKMEMESK